MLVKSLLVNPACELLFVFMSVNSLLVNFLLANQFPKTIYACEILARESCVWTAVCLPVCELPACELPACESMPLRRSMFVKSLLVTPTCELLFVFLSVNSLLVNSLLASQCP